MIRNLLTAILLSLFLVSCAENTTAEIQSPISSVDTLLNVPNQTVDKSTLFYNNKTSLWTLNDELYSGFSVSYYEDSIVKEKIGFLNGRKQNEAIQWFTDGHYKELGNYHKGKLHGTKKRWSADSMHILISHLNYQFGKAHGEQKKW